MRSGCKEILDYHFSVEFSFTKDVADMQRDILLGGGEEVCHLHLREPYGVLFEAYFELYGIIRLIEDYLSVMWDNFVRHIVWDYVLEVGQRSSVARHRHYLQFGVTLAVGHCDGSVDAAEVDIIYLGL